MARYESDSVGFAERQFEGVRQREDERVQQQKKREKKLLMLQTVAKGANALINQRAKELEAKQIPQKLNYLSSLEKSKKWTDGENERIKNNQSELDYLSEMYFNKLDPLVAEQFPSLDSNQLKQFSRKRADELAADNLDNYKNLIVKANNLSGLNETQFEEVYKNYSNIPRNIVSWVTGGVKSAIAKEDKNTVEYKAKQQDAFYGTGWDTKFGDFAESLRVLEAANGNGYDIAKVVTNIEKEISKNPLLGAKIDFQNAQTTTDTTLSEDLTTLIKKTKITAPVTTRGNKVVFKEFVSQTTEEFQPDSLTSEDGVFKMLDQVLPEAIDPLTGEKVKPQELLRKSITTESGRITNSSLQKGYFFITQNPTYQSPSWSDEKTKEDLFKSWVQSQYQFAFGEKDSTGYNVIKARPGDKGEADLFYISSTPASIAKAKELGLDDASLRKQWKNITSSDSDVPPQVGGGINRVEYQNWTSGKTKAIDYVETDAQKDYIKTNSKPAVGGGKGGALWEIFGARIKESEEDLVSFPIPINLNDIDPDIFTEDKKVNAHYDKFTNSFFFTDL